LVRIPSFPTRAFARLCATLLLICSLSAHAERADREQPLNIEADRMTADDVKQTAVFEGRVVATQGSMVLRADRLIIQKDAQGFEHATAFGNPATFRQKREGVDEWIDGEALRIEYDGSRQFVELFDKAHLTRDKDEVRGSYISYDSRADFYTVKGDRDAATPRGGSGDTRVRVRITPKPKEEGKAAPNAGQSLQPSQSIQNPQNP